MIHDRKNTSPSDTGPHHQRLRHLRDAPNSRRAYADSPLKPVSARPPFGEYVRQLYERRYFIRMQSWSQVTHQHRGMLLGNLWLILAPVLDGLAYFLIFGVLFQARASMANYFGYLVIGIFMFGYTSRVLVACTSSIHSNAGLIRAFTFPRASLPLASALRELISTIPVAVVMLALLILVPPGARFTPLWLLTGFVFALQSALNLGLGVVLARVGALVPDVRHLMPYLIRLWLYGSAVMFAVERFDTVPAFGQVVRANPLFVVLDMYRDLLLDNTQPAVESWGYLAVWAFASLGIGMVLFWQGEASYGKR